MTKTEYLESKRGLPYSQIVAEQPTEIVQGSLLKEHYQEIKTILANGLRLHLETFEANTPEKLIALYALKETFDPMYLADTDFKVNFALPEIYQKYLFCISTGALPQEFADQLINLSKYTRNQYNISLEDCAEYFGTANSKIETVAVNQSKAFKLVLNSDLPEPTYASIYYQAKIGDLVGSPVLIGQANIHLAGNYAEFCGYIPQGAKVFALCRHYTITGTLEVV